MANPINTQRTFGNNPMQDLLQDIEERLTSEAKVQKERNKGRTRLATSIAISVLLVASGGAGAATTTVALRCGLTKLVQGQAEIALIDKIAFGVGASATAYFCHRKVICYPLPADKLRDNLKKDVIYQKLKFSQRFDRETDTALRRLTRACPISMAYPRFPVRDIRRDEDGNAIGQVYEWAALNYMLTHESEGMRSCSTVNHASFDDFEFCEDLCRQIHRTLYEKNVIDSEDPVECLENELRDLGDLSPQESA